jgi:hypothetical protein
MSILSHDPLTQLSFSVYENKGVFAVLLGSGLSLAAGIPTGWEITLDLIRRALAWTFNSPSKLMGSICLSAPWKVICPRIPPQRLVSSEKELASIKLGQKPVFWCFLAASNAAIC